MIDTRCGLRCEGCEYKESCNCGGCIATNGVPFHGACPVAECCQNKGFVHCGECPDIPCALLSQYSCDPEHGDNPPGARIEQCRKWAKGEIMKVERCIKESFVVIGKEGSTLDGQGFIQNLWEDANSHFNEVQQLAKKGETGNLLGIWGAMSDLSHSFHPWEDDFSKGLYLAGVECDDNAEAPSGWTKWIIPGYEYIYVEVENETTFPSVLSYMHLNNLTLAGAVHDFTCPETGKNFMFFPIRTI